MFFRRRPHPLLVTISSVLAVLVLKLVMVELLKVESPLLLFFTPVAISAFYGGASQAALASLLSVFCVGEFFIPGGLRPQLLSSIWMYRCVLYLFDCAVITLVCVQLRRSKARVDAALDTSRALQISLAKSEAQLRPIFESNMIGLAFSRFDSKIYRANDYFLNLLGVDRKMLEDGKLNWHDFTPPEYLELARRTTELCRRGLPVPPFEKEYVRPDGSRVPVLVGATAVDESSMVAFVLDISARKLLERAVSEDNDRLEEKVRNRTAELQLANEKLAKLVSDRENAVENLRVSQDSLDSIIENIPNMIFVKDAKDLRFVRFNRAGEELLGLTREELVGKNDFDFFPHEQAMAFSLKDRAVLESNTVVDIPEEPIDTKYGRRWLHTKKIPIRDRDGRPQYLLGISEDISKRKEAEAQSVELLKARSARIEAEKSANRLTFLAQASAALNESLNLQEMLTAFTRSVVGQFADWCIASLYDAAQERIEPVASSTVNAAGVLSFANWARSENAMSDRSFAMSRVARTGRPIFVRNVDLMSGAELNAPVERMQEVIERGLKSLIIVPVIYQNRVLGTLTFISVTAGRNFDSLDFSQAEDLARRVAVAIENARLFSQANEASRAKSAFLANISHEIRTPLGAMLGFADLANEDSSLRPETSEYISTIVRNGRQLLRIVDEVLDLSKVESEKIEIESLRFSLDNLMDEVTSLLRVKADEKGLVLAVTRAANVPRFVMSDPTRLRQILINVVGNAIKFTDHGRIDVAISMSRPPSVDSKRAMIEILVSDTGIGIESRQAEKLFHPFVQADESMTRKFGGTGLGLFLSRKLARLMKGDVFLQQSVPGEGSRFCIRFEVGVAEDPALRRQPRPEGESASLVPDAVREMSILVVDDAPDNRTLIGAYLNRIGVSFETVSDGLAAIEIARQKRFDLILMDVQMPGMDGFETVRRLRAQGFKTTIVALTAHAMKGDRERCLENGFDDYLQKPLSRQSLIDCLIAHCQVPA